MIVTNDTLHPISLIILAGDLTLAEVDTMRTHFLRLHARQQRFFSYVDARFVSVPAPPVRHALGAMGADLNDATKKWCIGAGVTLQNKVLVGVLTAVRWFVTQDVDIRPFSTCLAALTWGSTLLRAEQLAPAPGLESLIVRLEKATPQDIGQFAAEPSQQGRA